MSRNQRPLLVKRETKRRENRTSDFKFTRGGHHSSSNRDVRRHRFQLGTQSFRAQSSNSHVDRQELARRGHTDDPEEAERKSTVHKHTKTYVRSQAETENERKRKKKKEKR